MMVKVRFRRPTKFGATDTVSDEDEQLAAWLVEREIADYVKGEPIDLGIVEGEVLRGRVCPKCGGPLSLYRTGMKVYCTNISCLYQDSFVPASQLVVTTKPDTGDTVGLGKPEKHQLRPEMDRGQYVPLNAVEASCREPSLPLQPVGSGRDENINGGKNMVEKNEAVKDLGDVMPRAMDVKGEQVTVEELVDKTIVIQSFSLLPSRFQDGSKFATIQILMANGEQAWTNTGSSPILDTLEQVKDKLPIRCKVASKKSKEGRRYYVLVSAKD